MKAEFPFLECIGDSETDLLCKVCYGRFTIAFKGRLAIKEHLKARKHLKSGKKENSDDSLTGTPVSVKLQGNYDGELLLGLPFSEEILKFRQTSSKKPLKRR
jgi:hypothetical protein